MNAKIFSEVWDKSPMIKYQLKNELASGLDELTAAQLMTYGMPKCADPWLNFMEFLIIDSSTTEIMKNMNFYPIGYLENGDIICVDKTNGNIMISDHEDASYTWMLNSSLEQLLESIVIFDKFIAEVNRENPEYTSNFKIPEGMLEELAKSFEAADQESYKTEGFWFTEISALSD